MLQSFIRRRVSVLACAVATAIIGIDFSIAGKPAHADIVDLTCAVGGETSTFSPGLTNTLRRITTTVDGAQTKCISLSEPEIKSAKYKFTLQGDDSCLNPTLPTYDITYNYNNGKFSKVHYVTSEEVDGEGETVVTSIGTVTDGEFKGDMVTRTVTDTTLSPEQCLTTQGVTSITGVVTVTFSR